MQVSVENTGALERVMTVELPEAAISGEVDSRLRSMSRTARLQGFRPGKVPLKLLRQRYGAGVREEVIARIVKDSFLEAATREKLRFAAPPVIDRRDNQGQGVTYTARFEILPEVRPRPAEELAVEKPVCELQEADVDSMIAKLRKQRREPRAVPRAAADGDAVQVDLQATVEGKPFAPGSETGVLVEIGADDDYQDFAAALRGKKAGAEVIVERTLPPNYRQRQLAGKTARFAVKVNEVCELAEPELNEEFFRQFGVEEGGEAAFRRELRRQMEATMRPALREATRDAVMRALLAANEVELPESLVELEKQELRRRTAQVIHGVRGKTNEALPPDLLDEMASRMDLDGQARKRLAAQLLMREIARANELKATAERVRAVIEQESAGYESPAAVIDWHYKNKEKLAEMESRALEDTAVEWLLERAQVTEKRFTFDELMKRRESGGE